MAGKSKGASKRYFYIAGVLKFEYKKAGFPDVKKIAEEWAKDPRFKFVIVRKVSEVAFGIQFVFVDYITSDKSKKERRSINDFFKKFVNKDLCYAWDVAKGFDMSDIIKWDNFNPEWVKDV